MCDGLLADMEKHSVKTVEKNLFGVNAIYLYCMLYRKCVKNVWLKLWRFQVVCLGDTKLNEYLRKKK